MEMIPFTQARPTPVLANPSLFPPELIRSLERIEAEAWADFYRAAPAGIAAAYGVEVDATEAFTMMAAPAVDILFFNRVVGLGMDVPATEACLDELVERYDAAGAPRFFIQLSPAALPADVFGWLKQRGLRHHNNWMKLYRGVEAPPEVATDLRVEVIGREQAGTFAHIVDSCFDWPEAGAPWLAQLVGRPGWQHYLVYDGRTPAATGALYVHGNCGYLGPAATLPAYRGRGAQGALIARRIHDAAALGCQVLVTETAQERPDHPVPSYRNMRRFGFQLAYARPNFIWYRPGGEGERSRTEDEEA